MIKLSLVMMVGFTVIIAMGLRWRDQRMSSMAPVKKNARRPGFLARGKLGLDRWVNAAALAAVATLLLLGGLHWIKVWNG